MKARRACGCSLKPFTVAAANLIAHRVYDGTLERDRGEPQTQVFWHLKVGAQP